MRICLFEDGKVDGLEPVVWTRPAFALRCGAATLLDRQRRLQGANALSAVVRPQLHDLCRLLYPALACNQRAAWQRPDTVYVNARWFAEGPIRNLDRPRIGMVGDNVAFVVGAPSPIPDASPNAVDAWLEECRERLPRFDAEGVVFDHLWDLVSHNGAALCGDEDWFAAEHRLRGESDLASVIGPRERLVVAEGAFIEPNVTIDTRPGPVLVDRGAVIQSFTRIEGPCYIGPGSWIVGGKIRGETTIGPGCRVSGEVEASIVQGFSNKYHDGFLGHSYVGEWVNLAAGTQTSDLRNDYGVVHTNVNGARLNTRKTKVGSFIGDHTKTGIGALLNTGSVVGVFANVLPSGSLAPQIIPSFCQSRYGQLHEEWDMRRLLSTAKTVMERRGQELTEAHQDLYYHLFDRLAQQRHKTVIENEARRLRMSV